MKHIAWLFKWLLKAAIFFTLFAFALNNQGDATVNFFFGYHWTSPMVLVVLAAFVTGLTVGVLGMVPRWWRHRREAVKARMATVQALRSASTDTYKQPAAPQADGL